MSTKTTGTLQAYFSAISLTLNFLPVDKVALVLAVLDAARMRRSRVYIFGNGGSAATASHFACDLTKGTIRSGKPGMRVYALADNVPVFSAWANDTGYENVFSEQLRDIVEPGDVVIAISGSGNSFNVIEGIRVAKSAGATTIGFSGFDGGRLAELADIAIVVPNNCMEQVEDIHLILTHAIAVCLRRLHSNILAITSDPEELARAARGYLEGGAYGKSDRLSPADSSVLVAHPVSTSLDRDKSRVSL